MGIFKSIYTSKPFYPIFLFLVTIISAGQMLSMYIWKDDNAIFFKFTHLAEPAGYLGRGLLGEGPYRLSVAPYWFVYRLFGYYPLYPYYVLAFLTYCTAIFSLYLFARILVGERAAKISTFLFAAGYIASEGFYWLASSWILSTSITLTLLCLTSIIVYIRKQKWQYYLFSIITYFLCLLITPVRTHYLIGIVITMFLFWTAQIKSFRSIAGTALKLIPFVLVFYWFYLVSADSRTLSISEFITSLVSGNIYVLYSFLSTTGTMFITDMQWKAVTPLFAPFVGHTLRIFVLIFVLTGASSMFLYIRVRSNINLLLSFLFALFSLSLFFISNTIVHSPQIGKSGLDFFIVYFGGFILLFAFFFSFTLPWNSRRNLLFLLVWYVFSLFVYTSYIPTSTYASIDRYLGHTFVALTLIYSFIAVNSGRRVLVGILLIWGISNIYYSFLNQATVVKNKSVPAAQFYTQLRSQLPEITKGDVLYIDVAPLAQEKFSAAFSVGQMPETTAVAWRYGVDRYDFQLITDGVTLQNKLDSNEITSAQIKSFFYNGETLVNTTSLYHKKSLGEFRLATEDGGAYKVNPPIASVKPLTLEVVLKATPSIIEKKQYPIVPSNTLPIFKDATFRDAAFKYLNVKTNYLKAKMAFSSSEWQDRVIANLVDQNSDTVWQPDRILWHDGKQSFTLDYGSVSQINRLAWINGFDNNTPVEYKIFTSPDNKTYLEVKSVTNIRKIDGGVLVEEKFESKPSQYVRMQLIKSLNDDAPGITEAWLVPAEFDKYSVSDLESFIANPLAVITTESEYRKILNLLSYRGLVNYSWKTNKFNTFQSSSLSEIQVQYDGKPHSYQIKIPSSGTELTQIKFVTKTIPGNIQVVSAKAL